MSKSSSRHEADIVQHAVLIYQRPDHVAGLSDEERQATSAEYFAIRDDPRVRGTNHQGLTMIKRRAAIAWVCQEHSEVSDCQSLFYSCGCS